MNIPKSINEMRDTPIPNKYLNLLREGDYEHLNLLRWLDYRCKEGPNRDEALARIRVHRRDTTELLPEKVAELIEKNPLTDEEWCSA